MEKGSIKKFKEVAQEMPEVEEPVRIVTPKTMKEKPHVDEVVDETVDIDDEMYGFEPVDAVNPDLEPIEPSDEPLVKPLIDKDEDKTSIFDSITEKFNRVSNDEVESEDVAEGVAEESVESAEAPVEEPKADEPESASSEAVPPVTTSDKLSGLSKNVKIGIAAGCAVLLAGIGVAAGMGIQSANSNGSNDGVVALSQTTGQLEEKIASLEKQLAEAEEKASTADEAEVVESEEETVETVEPADTSEQVVETDDDGVTWSTRYVLINHPAETYTVTHPTTYKAVTEYHTLCNVCKAEIDGKTDAHAAETGHSGYTTNVPVQKVVVDTESWSETVTKRDAYSELIEDGQVSSDGQVRNNKYNDDGTRK